MSAITIYSVTHKEYLFPKADWIQQIAVGGYYGNKNTLTDSIGINISKKNASYNEITAQYWVRYNRPSNYVGFVHYRRYFLFCETSFDKAPEFFSNDQNIINKLSAQREYDRCMEILNFCDIIIPRATYFPKGLKQHYLDNGVPAETWEAFSHFVSILFPESKKNIKYLELSNFGHMRNMFIMPWSLFTSYIDILIPVLDAVYREIGGSVYKESFKNRYPGFLAEHFLNLWLHTIPKRKFEIPILNLM